MPERGGSEVVASRAKVFLSSRFEEFADLRDTIKKRAAIVAPSVEIIDLNDDMPYRDTAGGRSLETVMGSDLVVVLLGRTYGDGTLSYVEQEWLKAQSSGIPWIAFSVPKNQIAEPGQVSFWEQVAEVGISGKISLEPGRESIDAGLVIEGILRHLSPEQLGTVDSAPLLELTPIPGRMAPLSKGGSAGYVYANGAALRLSQELGSAVLWQTGQPIEAIRISNDGSALVVRSADRLRLGEMGTERVLEWSAEVLLPPGVDEVRSVSRSGPAIRALCTSTNGVEEVLVDRAGRSRWRTAVSNSDARDAVRIGDDIVAVVDPGTLRGCPDRLPPAVRRHLSAVERLDASESGYDWRPLGVALVGGSPRRVLVWRGEGRDVELRTRVVGSAVNDVTIAHSTTMEAPRHIMLSAPGGYAFLAWEEFSPLGGSQDDQQPVDLAEARG